MAAAAAAAMMESRFGMDLLSRAFKLGDNAAQIDRPTERQEGRQTDRQAGSKIASEGEGHRGTAE